MFNKFIIVLLLFICVSCKKKEYPESATEGSPVFNCTMSVNGAPISFEAGVNNYYMYSSYQQDSNGVYGFNASLKQTNCVNCANGLNIKINDFKVSAANANTIIDSSLAPGNYNYLFSTAASFYTAQFQSSYNKIASSYLWNFGDGTTSTSSNPVHTYKKSGKYNVSLTVNGTNSCVNTINGFHNVGIVSDFFRTTIHADSVTGNLINFNANNAQGTAPYSYEWNFGDGTPNSVSATPSHNYQYAGSYPVSLKVTDFNGNIAEAKYNVVTQSDISSCAANYSISNVNYSPNTLGLSNIIIDWTDANGVVYSSKNPLQPSNSYFKILSVENFKNNDNNQLTKKIHVQFACTVYNGANTVIISNADAVICVAYK